MNKHKNIISNAASVLLAFAAFSMTFASCASDDELVRDAAGKSVEITVGVTSANGIDTRTNLEEGDDRMACTWAEGDKLLVTDTSGKVLSTLSITEGVGQKTATFTGMLGSMSDGSVKLNFTYLGASASLGGVTESTFKVNLAQQDGLQTTLNDYDIMSAQANVLISGSCASIASGITLNKLLAIGHFALKFPVGVSMTDETVVISGDNLKNATVVNLSNGSITGSTDGNIIIEDSNGDFYLNLIPAAGVTPQFTVTIGGTEYIGTLAAKDIAGGDFICEGNKVGVSVEMKTSEVIDHSKNPLNKWAETNLVYNHGSDKSEFATAHTDGGSLYQWGRNHGFADYNDAMGIYKSSNGTYQFGVYNNSYACGKGFWPGSGGEDIVSLRYTGSDNVRANKTLYMMSTINESSSNDYWCFPDGGSNWNERAEKCNYATAICPEGWRMPTEADFAEIFPKKGINTSDASLSSQLSGYSELKEIESVCKYVIRWDIETAASKKILKIRALVVDDSFEESALSSVNWESEEVVTRYFSATGAIEGFYHLHKIQSGNYVYDFPVAMPMPFGTWIAKAIGNSSVMTIEYQSIVDAGKTYEGAYWVSDQKKIYRFREHQNSFGSENKTSFIGASVQPAYNAFAVRCVKE